MGRIQFVIIRQGIAYILLLCLMNFVISFHIFHLKVGVCLLGVPILVVFFVFYSFFPNLASVPTSKLRALIGGYRLLIMGCICFMTEALFYFCLLIPRNTSYTWLHLTLNGVMALAIVAAMLINGFVRLFVTSYQLGVLRRMLLVIFWWVPLLNLVFLFLVCSTVKKEFQFYYQKHLLNERRKEEQICKTKYPLLLVHGIFFRDWGAINYWGRIPGELTKNGATIHYGKQQSSTSVEESGEELKRRIHEILKETGCKKVNIIAHSKGGLDSRYAISCLKMAPHVASITTVNTPHHGCKYTDKIFQKTPFLVSTAGKAYNKLFQKLGDKTPDFVTGVKDLTEEECEKLNKGMGDAPGVLYQSVGSKIKAAKGVDFPFNIGYRVIKAMEGDNDGLVTVKSMTWTGFMGAITTDGKKDVSHADIVDFSRKIIPGFDVCEFYVQLVSDLREKGL